MNKKFEEQFQSAMSPEYIVKNAIVCDRWVKLIDEVKEIFVAVGQPFSLNILDIP